jgi:uncharacterized membrane protein (DUF4010 family)
VVFAAWRSLRGGQEDGGEVPLVNPFRLAPALRFGALFAAILLVAGWLQQQFGSRGVYLGAAVSGVADVDAIVLSLAELSRGGGVAIGVAAIGVLIAAAVNTLVKAGIATAQGGRRLALSLWPVAIAMLAAGAAAIALFPR